MSFFCDSVCLSFCSLLVVILSPRSRILPRILLHTWDLYSRISISLPGSLAHLSPVIPFFFQFFSIVIYPRCCGCPNRRIYHKYICGITSPSCNRPNCASDIVAFSIDPSLFFFFFSSLDTPYSVHILTLSRRKESGRPGFLLPRAFFLIGFCSLSPLSLLSSPALFLFLLFPIYFSFSFLFSLLSFCTLFFSETIASSLELIGTVVFPSWSPPL